MPHGYGTSSQAAVDSARRELLEQFPNRRLIRPDGSILELPRDWWDGR